MENLHFEEPVVVVAFENTRSGVLLFDERLHVAARGQTSGLSHVDHGTLDDTRVVHIDVHRVPTGLQFEDPPGAVVVRGIGLDLLDIIHTPIVRVMLRRLQRLDDIRGNPAVRQVLTVVIRLGVNPVLAAVEIEFQFAVVEKRFDLRTAVLRIDLHHTASLVHDIGLEVLLDAALRLLRKLIFITVVRSTRHLVDQNAVLGEIDIQRSLHTFRRS